MTPNKVVTRFAPSPTGFLHVGGVRTALYAWLYTQQQKGTLILRIEDTDKEREVEGSIAHIIESLTWLGIAWNEGPDIGGPHAPYLQSQRLDSYKKHAKILIEKGLAYADPYTTEELEAFRKKSEDAKKPFLYREHRPENPPAWDGTQPLRLKSNPKKFIWEDAVRGKLTAGEEAVDDFILIKSDGYPTYNFAHIIDDLEMGVTHIFRADEFISSTPKFLSLYEALGIEHPVFVTLPPIMGPDGKKKLGKRDGAKDILEYRNEGIIPVAMMNFLAFIGWNPGDEREIMNPQELIAAFDISKIHASGGKFNEEKLKWINKQYLEKLSADILFEKINKEIQTKQSVAPEVVKRLIPIILERIQTFGDIKGMIEQGELDYVFGDPTYDAKLVFWKDETDSGVVKKRLEQSLSLIEKVDAKEFNKDTVKTALWDYATSEGKGQVLWPIRIALSGKDKSPDPFVLAELLGKDVTINRIKKALEMVSHA